MTINVEKCKIGQSFDDFLKKQGLYEFIKTQALATIIVDLSLEQPEVIQHFSKEIEMITTSQHVDQNEKECQEIEFENNMVVHLVNSASFELKYVR